MRILVTSANGANGHGYGTILAFGPEGEFTGPFSTDPRITDPRGMSVEPSGALVYVNSGDDRILALDRHGHVIRDSGRWPGLDVGGGEFGPDGRYYVTMRRPGTIGVLTVALEESQHSSCRKASSHSRGGLASATTAGSTLRPVSRRPGQATTPLSSSIGPGNCARLAWSPTPS
jgi:hypothetical protein